MQGSKTRFTEVCLSSPIQSVCVFCGSSAGNEPEYALSGKALGAALARSGLTLVYGGGNVGIMGECARSALAAGGRVVGVIPERIFGMVQHMELSEIHVVAGMHERKAKMYELADGFIILPGGIGTMEEFFEVYTWYQLGYHEKPIGMLNVKGFFDPLLALLRWISEKGFMRSAHLDMLIVDDDPERLIETVCTKRFTYIDKFGKHEEIPNV